MSLKQIEVQILGQSYLLGCPPGGELRLLSAVEKVDTAMCRIRDAGKVKARDRIAVLAALNLAFEVPDTPPPAATAPAGDAGPASGTSSQSTRPMPAEADPAPGESALDPAETARLAALLQRLDAVLAQDGRLI